MCELLIGHQQRWHAVSTMFASVNNPLELVLLNTVCAAVSAHNVPLQQPAKNVLQSKLPLSLTFKRAQELQHVSAASN